jgi:hypothetical protein
LFVIDPDEMEEDDSDVEVEHVQKPTTTNNTPIQGMVITPSDYESSGIEVMSVVGNNTRDNISSISTQTTVGMSSTANCTSTKKRKNNKVTPSDAKKNINLCYVRVKSR